MSDNQKTKWESFKDWCGEAKDWCKDKIAMGAAYGVELFIGLVTLFPRFIRAMFYAPIIDPDTGVVTARYFSLSRFFYCLATGVIVFRLFVGGVQIEDVKMGPQVAWLEKGGRATASTSKPAVRKKLKRGKGRGRKKVASVRLTPKVEPPKVLSARYITKSRPWFYAKRFVFSPLTMNEILGYLVIVLLYYFRNNFNSGDQEGLFSRFLGYMAKGYAASKGVVIQEGGVSPITDATIPSAPVDDASVKLPPDAYDAFDKPSDVVDSNHSGRRGKRGKRKVEKVPDSKDPFLND